MGFGFKDLHIIWKLHSGYDTRLDDDMHESYTAILRQYKEYKRGTSYHDLYIQTREYARKQVITYIKYRSIRWNSKSTLKKDCKSKMEACFNSVKNASNCLNRIVFYSIGVEESGGDTLQRLEDVVSSLKAVLEENN